MNRKSKNTVKNRCDFVGNFTCDCKCACVNVCAYVCVCVCVFLWVAVAYYCVCMCEWYIWHECMKVHAQCVVFTGC